jgi:aryl-alcohol dehydrogenase-like predicted oxidoreductase
MNETRCIAGKTVSAIGLGCMNLSHAYGVPPPPEQAKAVLHLALDLGITHFDTAALYGFGRNESLLGEVLFPFRQRLFIASKCGMTGVDGKRVIDGRPQTLRATLDESLRRLGIEHIDLYYLHRWDRAIALEESIGALADLVAAGKIGAIGLSEVSAATLRRAHAVHPIAAVQSEYSLWSRNVEISVLDECERIGAVCVAFSPLARGFLTDAPLHPADFTSGDIRLAMPRFQEPHWAANQRLRADYCELARRNGHTPAQLALAWLLHRSPRIVPIPGTTSCAHLKENVAATSAKLEPRLMGQLEALINQRTVSGARYSAQIQKEIDTEEFSPA